MLAHFRSGIRLCGSSSYLSLARSMNLRAYIFGIGCMLISRDGLPVTGSLRPKPSAQSEPRWIEIGSEKVVIARDSKSADGRNALALDSR